MYVARYIYPNCNEYAQRLLLITQFDVWAGTSIHEQSEGIRTIRIFPNPVKDKLYFQSEKPLEKFFNVTLEGVLAKSFILKV
jgi:hypothetical protein